MMIDLPIRRGYEGRNRVSTSQFLRMRPLWLNYNGSAKLTDFQVKCTLTPSDIPFEKLRADKQDLLFVDNNNEAIPYWIEKADSTEIIVWLKFSEITPGREVFWLYYGNGNFSGASDAKATFIIFDDFEDNDLGTYNWTEDGGNFFSEVNGYLRSSGDGSSGESIIYATSKLLPESYVAEYKCWVRGVGSIGNYRNVNPGLRVVDGINNRIDVIIMPAHDPYFHKVKDGASVSEDLNIITGSTFRCCSEEVWHDVKVVVKRNNYKIYVDGELGIEFEDTKSDFLANSHWGFAFSAGYNEINDEQRYDDLRIRKYTEPEPFVSV